MLADKIEYYKETGEMLKNTPAQYKKEFEWLKEVDSLVLVNAQQNLEKAYKNFFRDKSIGFPKFKSKKTNYYSYTTNNQKGTVYIENNHVKIPKLKTMIKSSRGVRSNGNSYSNGNKKKSVVCKIKRRIRSSSYRKIKGKN